MALPELTSADRAAAANAAVAARRRRAQVKMDLTAGRLTLRETLTLSDRDDAVAKMRVVDMLGALPRIGPVRATAIMSDVGIAPSRRMRGLGYKQREALLRRFEGM